MLGKLIKYELKATSRFFMPLFLAVLIMTPVTRMLYSLDFFRGYLSIIPGFFSVLYALLLAATAVVSFVIVIYRFYRNMVTDEGYLMHTLPVKPSLHIWSKTIVACFWTIVSMIVVLLSLFVFFITPERMRDLTEFLSQALHETIGLFGQKVYILLLVELIIMCVLSLICNIFYIYASITIGHVISRHKIIGAFAAAVVLNIISQVLGMLILIPIVFLSDRNMNNPYIITSVLFPCTIVLSLILTIGYFLCTNYILTKKLNLE